MRLASLSIAVVAALAAGQASATTQILNGASASQINVVKALRTLCTGNAGTFKLYKTSSATNSLGNIVTSTCTGAAFTTDGVDQVRSNVAGGSLSAVINSTGYGNVAVARIDPTAATCTALGAGTEVLSFLPAGEMQNCNATGQVNQTGGGGFLDVEGAIFAANGLSLSGADPAAEFVQSNFLQAFAVGVSTSLYNTLQAYQTAQGQLDSTCATTAGTNPVVYTATGSTTPLCQPSVSRAQMAAIINNINNASKRAGANFLIGGTTTTQTDLVGGAGGKAIVASQLPAVQTNLTYCRRPNTSGTQASTQLYFLSSPTANGDLAGQLTISNPVADGAAAVTYSNGVPAKVTTTVTMNSGTSNVKTCLDGATDYAIGTLSAENNPVGGTDTYRFVKVNGVSVTEGVAGASNTAEAIAGRYDFVFETFKFCPLGTCASVLDAVDAALPAGASSPGLFLGTEGKANRGGKSTAPYIIK
jgi:hypothetical protein